MGKQTILYLMVNIKNGDLIYIIYDKRRRWLRKLEIDKQFHSDKGYFAYKDIIGKPYGTTHLLQPSNQKIAVLKPTISNIIFHMKRESQIIYPEDIGLILIYGKVKAHSKVLEAGTGSGTVSSILGLYSQPGGFLQTYDVRENALNQAIKNIHQMGAQNYVKAQIGNILEENLHLSNQDFIMLDLATPWNAVLKIIPYLSPKGRVCLFSPTIEQVKKNVNALKQEGFQQIINLEQLQRKFQVKPNATRPKGRMIGHTGYLTFATKDSTSMISQEYNAIYSPSNIGNLIIYGNIDHDSAVLVISYLDSPLYNILQDIFPEKSNLYLIQLDSNNEISLQLQMIEKTILSFNILSKEYYATIVFDNIYLKDLIITTQPFLMKSGVFASINHHFEGMKEIFDQMQLNQYYDIESWEILCREIVIQEPSCLTFNKPIDQQGYLTFGRKVVDTIQTPDRLPKEPQFVEPLLDVAVNFAEETEPEPEKIDYANIRE